MAHPPPPVGHSTWLDYAVSTMDTRSVSVQNLFDEDSHWTRADMKQAARDELAELRRLAGQANV